MQNYEEFLKQNVDFPQEGFEVKEGTLFFEGINLMELIYEYGTPLRFTYLPCVSKKIQKAKLLFNQALLNNNYKGTYTYCYCTKSNHLRAVLEEALKNDIHVETSSAYDVPIIRALYRSGRVTKDNIIICNGFKTKDYTGYITELIHDGFQNTIPVLDNMEELNDYDKYIKKPFKLGIRIATEERPNFEFYTSRLGIRAEKIIEFYLDKIKGNPKFNLKLLHFFVNSGIKDTPYYWNELEKCVHLYCQLKKEAPELEMIDIGGGFPFRSSLDFEYDFEYITNQIIETIKKVCEYYQVPEPSIVTEFGSFTVSESSGIIFEVIGRKQQNDREAWYMIDGSLMTTLPDIWAINQRFILLPVNSWNSPYQRVNIGGMTCDSEDYYNQEVHRSEIYLPKARKPLFIGFFHTGAYQQALAGTGGLNHCLLPAPKHVIIDKDENGELRFELFKAEQKSDEVLKLLGYMPERSVRTPSEQAGIPATEQNGKDNGNGRVQNGNGNSSGAKEKKQGEFHYEPIVHKKTE